MRYLRGLRLTCLADTQGTVVRPGLHMPLRGGLSVLIALVMMFNETPDSANPCKTSGLYTRKSGNDEKTNSH